MKKRILLTALMVTLTGQPGALGRVNPPPPVTACEGDACAQITLAFDAEKGQYRVQNNSTDHWVRVTASNLAASAAACLAPGASADLPLKSIVGAYRAAYAEPKCGAGPGT